jgi:hypothetical protein
MSDVFTVAKLLMDNAIKNYGQEVDIIAYSGSYARGEARDDSDLDIFYIPADGKNPPIGRTFLLDGILFDFWAINWKTMEGFATGRIRSWAFAPALVHHAKILHARSDDQAARLEGLKRQIRDLQKPEARPQMIRRALRNFGYVMGHVANLRLALDAGNLTDIRYAGWKVVKSTWECLALANQVFFDRGLAKALSESEKFKDKPTELDHLIETITTSPDPSQILGASELLAMNTRQVLYQVQKSIPSDSTVYEQFQQVYPEMRDTVAKLLAACERGDAVVAHAEAMLLQHDVTLTLNRTTDGIGDSDFNLYSELAAVFRELQFPDLLKFASSSLQELSEQAKLFDERLRWFLREHSVDLCEFKTLDEIEQSLQRDR